MAKSRPVYNKIKLLVSQLDDPANNVKKRREAAQSLRSLLGDPGKRKNLALEASQNKNTDGKSIRSIQRAAVAHVWRLIMQSALAHVDFVAGGKAKMCLEDIELPSKLLRLSDHPDGLFDEYVTRLSKDDTKRIFKYCMKMLEDDNAMKDIIGAEKSMIDLLCFICSKREFVAYFSSKQFSAILETIEERLCLEEDDVEVDQEIAKKSAETMLKLLSTCQELGFSLHQVLPSTLKMIALWFHKNEPNSLDNLAPDLLASASILLHVHPDLAVDSLKRYGFLILGYVKRFLQNAGLQTAPVTKATPVIDYLTNHLIVCQVAGKFEGRMQGDLGDFGKSNSLSLKTMYELIDALITKCELSHRVLDKDDSMQAQLYRKELELLVRLFACAQRSYLCAAEWTEIEDPMRLVETLLEDCPTDNYLALKPIIQQRKYNLCSTEALSRSPFIEKILCILNVFSKSDVSNKRDVDSQTDNVKEGQDSSAKLVLKDALDIAGIRANHNDDEKSIVVRLQIIASAAELFPLGNCWATSAQNNWITACGGEDDIECESVAIQASSLDDLAAVVGVLGAVLESQGGYGASSILQKWILICLNRLTIATASSLEFLSSRCDSASVTFAWQKVWKTLVCSDRRYSGLTRTITLESNGDLVVRLLTQIVRYGCTLQAETLPKKEFNELFIVQQQNVIWNLPVYHNVNHQSPSPFWLMYIFINEYVLMDDDIDSVGLALTHLDSWCSRASFFPHGRKSRLVNFCLTFLETSVAAQKDSRIISAVSACLSSLLTRFSIPLRLVLYANEGNNYLDVAEMLLTPVDRRLCTVKTGSKPLFNDLSSHSKLFGSLWTPVLKKTFFVSNSCNLFDITTVALRGVLSKVMNIKRQYNAHRNDGDKICEPYLSSVCSVLVDIIAGSDDDCGDDGSSTLRNQSRMIMLKAYINIMVPLIKPNLDMMFALLVDCFKSTANGDFSGCQESNVLIHDFIQIVRGLVVAKSHFGIAIDSAVFAGASALYEWCKKVLDQSCIKLDHVNFGSTLKANPATDSLFDDEGDCGSSVQMKQGKETTLSSETVGKKRKSREVLEYRKKQRSEETIVYQFSRESKYLLGALLLALDTTSSNCHFVARILIENDLEDDDFTEFDIDIPGGIDAVRMICSSKKWKGEPSEAEAASRTDGSSVVSLVCSLVRVIRCCSTPHSLSHLYGFDECAEIIRSCSSNSWGESLSEADTEDLADLLKDPDDHQERRSLVLRHSLRAHKLRASTVAFKHSTALFDSHFGNDFGPSVLSPALSDPSSGLVRCAAFAALKTAMRKLDEQKVIINVRKFAKSSIDNQEYLSHPKESNVSPIQYDSFFNYSIAAGSVSSIETMQRILFDFIVFAADKPLLAKISFHAIERVALMRGYESAEEILHTENRALAHLWLEANRNIHDMPLLLSSPSVFRRILFGRWLDMKNSSNEVLDSGRIERLALSEFLICYQHNFVPKLIILSLTSISGKKQCDLNDNEGTGDNRMEEICSIISERHDRDAMVKIIKSNLACIVAEASFLCHTGNLDFERQLMSWMKTYIPEKDIKARCRKVGIYIVRRLIEVIGEHDDEVSIFTLLSQISNFCGERGSLASAASVLASFDTNIIEQLLHSKLRLFSSPRNDQMLLRWKSVDCVVDFLLGCSKYGSASFEDYNHCIYLMLGFLVDTRFTSVHVLCLDLLKRVLVFVVESNQETSLGEDVQRDISGVLFELHKKLQFETGSSCIKSFSRKIATSNEVQGLLGEKKVTTTFSFDYLNLPTDFNRYEGILDENIILCLSKTTEVLEILTKVNRDQVHKYIIDFLYLDKTDDLLVRFLAALNPLLAAQKKLREICQPNLSSNHVSRTQSTVVGKISSHLIGFDAVLISELELQKRRLIQLNAPKDEILVLIPWLLDLCTKSRQEDVRLRAAQCLGEIPPFALESFCDQNAEALDHGYEIIFSAIEDSNLPMLLYSNVLERILNSVKDSNARIALVALDTLKAVFSSSIGKRIVTFMSRAESSTLRAAGAMIKAVCCCVSSNNYLTNDILLADYEIAQLHSDSEQDRFGNFEWCWSDELWSFDLNKSVVFESWICRVVPSLVVCCYKDESTNLKKESFFWLCLRICCLEPAVAVMTFKCLVFNLLWDETFNPSADRSTSNRLQIDTWLGNPDSYINMSLSECFNKLLTTCGGISDHRFATVVIDLLDFLFVFTQERFLCSKNHEIDVVQRNDGSGKKQRKKDPKPAGPSRGLIHGTVLRVDGLAVARACIQAERFESALFYADLYADNMFGSSTCAIAHIMNTKKDNVLVTSQVEMGDISGFPGCAKQELAMNKVYFTYLKLLDDAFTRLKEHGSRNAASQLISDLDFLNGEDNSLTTSRYVGVERPKLTQLLHLDSLGSRSFFSEPKVLLADLLERINMEGLVENYVAGIVSSYDAKLFSPSDKEKLREMYFQSRLYKVQWDDELFHAKGPDYCTQPRNEVEGLSKLWCGREGFNELIYKAVCSLHSDDHGTCKDRVTKAQLLVLEKLSLQGTDKAKAMDMQEEAARLRILNDINFFADNWVEPGNLLTRITSSDQDDISLRYHFKTGQLVDSIRDSIIPLIVSRKGGDENTKNQLVTLLSKRFHEQIRFDRPKAAEETLYKMNFLLRNEQGSIAEDGMKLLKMKEALLLECRGDIKEAIHTSRLVFDCMKLGSSRSEEEAAYVDALLLCGQLASKYKVEPAGFTLDRYLVPAGEKAQKIYERHASIENADRFARSMLTLSQLAFNLLDTVSEKIQSREWQEAEAGLVAKRRDLEDLQSKLKTKGKEQIILIARKSRKIGLDISREERHRNEVQESIRKYSLIAFESTLKALILVGNGEREDMSKHVYSLVSLWFDMKDENSWSTEIEHLFNDVEGRVPTFRFVPMINQLLSRIQYSSKTNFQNWLERFITKIAFQHPYHCIMPILSLAGIGDCDNQDFENDEERSKQAKSILENLRNANKVLLGKAGEGLSELVTGLIDSSKRIAACYSQLAKYEARDRAKTMKLSSVDGALARYLTNGLKNEKYPPCILTRPPDIQPDCAYGDEIIDPIGSERLESFESEFAIAPSGMSRPKIVVCIGRQKGRFKELVKGRDDTRQDAVMQQVFFYVNEVLKRQQQYYHGSGSRQRDRLITYNIIPINAEAGVLEWVEDSIPFGDFVKDKGKNHPGAHTRYYPNEWTFTTCYETLYDAQAAARMQSFRRDQRKSSKKDSNDDTRNADRQAFDLICKNYSPIFRYFFTENFAHSPENWYAAKMRYIRSVAVSSIVGHILGIGDRHLGNILVHKNTGEVIHIDFGYVFEQGKLLEVPELVPFRLTRNIVDGMGPMSINGVFTKTCETTLSVLRQNTNGLQMILSSILSDPLYHWTNLHNKENDDVDEDDDVNDQNTSNGTNKGKGSNTRTKPSSKKRSSLDQTSSNHGKSRDEMAALAMRRILNKLQGFEQGTGGEQQSIESQVEWLIHEARSADNLCKLFVGWAPWV